jgi:hypothetical protein
MLAVALAVLRVICIVALAMKIRLVSRPSISQTLRLNDFIALPHYAIVRTSFADLLHQPTSIFMIHCLIATRLQVRMLFEESVKGQLIAAGGLSKCLHAYQFHKGDQVG